jgi:hypothetical protein
MEYWSRCERLTWILKWLREDNWNIVKVVRRYIQFYPTVIFMRTSSGWNWISTVCFNSEVWHWWTRVDAGRHLRLHYIIFYLFNYESQWVGHAQSLLTLSDLHQIRQASIYMASNTNHNRVAGSYELCALGSRHQTGHESVSTSSPIKLYSVLFSL